MGTILVSGLVNMETTVRVERFPVDYSPVLFPFFGVSSRPAGVGLNLSLALTRLGDTVRLLSFTGRDGQAAIVRSVLEEHGIDTAHVLPELRETPESVILYDPSGKRQIYCDLKDVQERAYRTELFPDAAADADIVCLCNINYSRALLPEAKKLGKLIATDVQVLGDLHDGYNSDFMRYADILFMSGEKLPEEPASFVRKVAAAWGNRIIVVGLGAEGALLYVRDDGYLGLVPAVRTREVVNTIGAGDSLFASFIHYYAKTRDPYLSLDRAVVFASYKIGSKGASEGFLTEAELDDWCRKTEGTHE